jgi:hypothetical protein
MNEREATYDWEVRITGKARKQVEKLPPGMAEQLKALLLDLRGNGPEAKSWPHSGPLKGKKEPGWYHCHLNKGKPRYVAIWQVIDNVARLMEVRYAGTHENAKYRQIN